MSATIHYLPCTRQIRPSGKRPSPVQLAWLRRGLRNADGRLPLAVGGGWVRAATVDACVRAGWAGVAGRLKIPLLTDGELVRHRLTAAGRMAAATKWSGE